MKRARISRKAKERRESYRSPSQQDEKIFNALGDAIRYDGSTKSWGVSVSRFLNSLETKGLTIKEL